MEQSYIPIIIGGLIGLFAAILSQVLTAILTEYKSRRDERKNTKRVLKTALYHQFELYGELLKLNQTIHSDFADKIKELLTSFGIDNDLASNFTKIPDSLYDYFDKAKVIDTADIGKRYEDIIEKIAEVEPLLATQISQRVRLRNREFIDDYFEKLMPVPNAVEPAILQFADRIRIAAKQRANSRLVESIEKSIYESARRIDTETFDEVSKELKKLKDKISNKKLEIVDEQSKELVNLMVSYSKELQKTETNKPDLTILRQRETEKSEIED